MFTGIIEALGRITNLEREGSNLHIRIHSPFTTSLKVDQSVAHNGVCLTVVAIEGEEYTVTAIDETLEKTNVGHWKVDDEVNLERAMISGARLDGHMVQGHVDQTAVCRSVEEVNGSWNFSFEFPTDPNFLLVDKGSVCIDGVSLTVVEAGLNKFSVSIIPYTYQHTVFKRYRSGSIVNIEFDVIGKYVARYMEHYSSK